jgi:hypothetical protein
MERQMKIIKELIIKANINDTWSWLTSGEAIQEILCLGADKKCPSDPTQILNLTTDPPSRLSFNGCGLSPSIITTFELSDRGIRTGLKVTISGWETVDPKTARIEMPQVSLDWEKKLNLLKKSIESATANRCKT